MYAYKKTDYLFQKCVLINWFRQLNGWNDDDVIKILNFRMSSLFCLVHKLYGLSCSQAFCSRFTKWNNQFTCDRVIVQSFIFFRLHPCQFSYIAFAKGHIHSSVVMNSRPFIIILKLFLDSTFLVTTFSSGNSMRFFNKKSHQKYE